MKKLLMITSAVLAFSTTAFGEEQTQIVAPETMIKAAPPPNSNEGDLLFLEDEFALPQGASKELIAKKAKLTTAQAGLQKAQYDLADVAKKLDFETAAPVALETLRKSITNYDNALVNVEQAEQSFIDEKLNFVDSRQEKFAVNK